MVGAPVGTFVGALVGANWAAACRGCKAPWCQPNCFAMLVGLHRGWPAVCGGLPRCLLDSGGFRGLTPCSSLGGGGLCPFVQLIVYYCFGCWCRGGAGDY